MSSMLHPEFVANWTFRASPPTLAARATRLRCLLKGRRAFPAHQTLTAPERPGEWSIYFIYAPDGRIDDGHRYTIDRLRRSRRALMLVVATAGIDMIDPLLADVSDALIWKDLPGYDFSGFALGLNCLARYAPGSSAFVLNDSVLGPLSDIDPILDGARWDLTGFSASESEENHIQSFAFYLKRVDPTVVAAFGDIFSENFSYDDFLQTVMLRETRFARLASDIMSVGSKLYTPKSISNNPTVLKPLEMIDAGFPFMKRALFGKHRDIVDRDRLLDCLNAAGHPAFG